MVPNHIGPDGDYLTQTGPYERGAGKFGGEFNYEGKNNKYVRDWMVNAALWWANEFKVDGIRLDMTKMCGSDYLLKQIVSEVNLSFISEILLLPILSVIALYLRSLCLEHCKILNLIIGININIKV